MDSTHGLYHGWTGEWAIIWTEISTILCIRLTYQDCNIIIMIFKNFAVDSKILFRSSVGKSNVILVLSCRQSVKKNAKGVIRVKIAGIRGHPRRVQKASSGKQEIRGANRRISKAANLL